jgi:GST-like protein
MTQPIALYYWPTPNGWKISIALEEMGVPYETHFVNIGAGDQFTPQFEVISPNRRMPAIVDPDGPGGQPISVFESGAILQYLGRKYGKLYPADERARVKVDEWLFWQVGGLGPMAGQTHHFRGYAPTFIKDQAQVAYGAIRYTNETHRLYGVLDKQLRGKDFITGDYSIADIACWGWIVPWKLQGIQIEEFPDLKAWFERMSDRPAVQNGKALAQPKAPDADDPKKIAEDAAKARAVLFGQRAVR